jgi:aminopeptidase N
MLRKLPCLLILLLVIAVPTAGFAHDLINQELSVRLLPAEHTLEGRATLTRVDGHAGWPEDYALAAGAVIDSVAADGKPLPYTFRQGRLKVSPPSDSKALAIVYRARFDDPVPQEIVGIEDPSYGVTATIMPQGTYLSSAAAWHPVPVGMNSLFRVTISGPDGLTGVTAGRLVDHAMQATATQTVWQTELPQPALALAAGAYRMHQAELGETQVMVFLTDANTDLAAGYLESCREYLQLYQKLFGPYPYAKFAVVENFYPTGYGLPGWTLLGSRVIRLPFIRTTSLPHEIAHAWWGNAVKVDHSSGNWAEGLATYVADYYLQELASPAEALEYRRKILRDYAALVDAADDLPLTAFRSRLSKRDQAIGYGKAAMVFHMLRERIGDHAFWTGLQSAAGAGVGKRYAWSDLQRHFEAASDRELGGFFRQWTARPGAPQLLLADVELNDLGDGWRVSGKLRQQGPFYDMQVPLLLETANHRTVQTLNLDAGQADFEFMVADRPVSLTVDPDTRLFRKLYPEELPATVNDLRASRSRLVIVADGAETLLEASRDLLRGLQWQHAEVTSEADYFARRPVDSDLLVLGWPQSPELRPVAPAGSALPGAQFQVGQSLPADPADVLFMVVGKPGEERVTGYFLPGSPAAARDTARRIPHYGRYSYLAFSGGRNQLKATWEPARSPLKIQFAKEIVP